MYANRSACLSHKDNVILALLREILSSVYLMQASNRPTQSRETVRLGCLNSMMHKLEVVNHVSSNNRGAILNVHSRLI